MEKIKIETRDDYFYARMRGYDALYDKRCEMPIALRKEIQKYLFGKNNAEGNRKFYRYCIERFPMVCEECGRPIDNPWAGNVSHILTRGAHPEKAHDPRNINILCLRCHERWENGDRSNMRIYEKNQRTIEQLKKEYANL